MSLKGNLALSIILIKKHDFVSGKFEPVKWSCRARLPSGKLCPRKDREKCPLHGKIVARDNMGQPSTTEDRLAEEKREEEEKQRNPDWQDSNLLRELKAATGVDLKMPTKRGRGEHLEVHTIHFASFMFLRARAAKPGSSMDDNLA